MVTPSRKSPRRTQIIRDGVFFIALALIPAQALLFPADAVGREAASAPPSAMRQKSESSEPIGEKEALTLEKLTQRAGLIFLGTVVRVEVRKNSSVADPSIADTTAPRETAFARITFRVTDGIRGVRSGEIMTVREWSGLWSAAAPPRYRTGENLLMFYYPPSAAGLTSPVGGSAGRFEIISGRIVVSGERARILFRRSRRLSPELNAASENKNNAAGSVGYREMANAIRAAAAASPVRDSE